MNKLLIVLVVIFILGMASPTQDKLDTILANQEQILDEIEVNRMYLVRIHDLMTGGESFCLSVPQPPE